MLVFFHVFVIESISQVRMWNLVFYWTIIIVITIYRLFRRVLGPNIYDIVIGSDL